MTDLAALLADVGPALAALPGVIPKPRFTVEWGMLPPRTTLATSRLPKGARDGMQRLELRKVPAAFLPLYTQCDGFGVSWERVDAAYSPAVVVGQEKIARIERLFEAEAGALHDDGPHYDQINLRPIWDKHASKAFLAEAAAYSVFSVLTNRVYVVWRAQAERVELALYLGGERLHSLPFSPVEYVETALAFRFLELWQLLFLPAEVQTAYGAAISVVRGHVRHFCPAAEALLPAQVAADIPQPPTEAPVDYRHLFHDMVSRLKTIPGILLRVEEPLAPGVSLGVVERVRRELGQPLPPDLLAFYSQLNGCSVQWELPPLPQAPASALPPEGSIRLWPLGRVFGGSHNEMRPYWDDMLNSEVNNALWARSHVSRTPALAGFRPFEHLNSEVYPGLKLPGSAPEPFALCLLGHPDTSELAYLRLTFAQYLATAFAVAGTRGWQRHFLQRAADAAILGDLMDAPPLPDALQAAGFNPIALLHP